VPPKRSTLLKPCKPRAGFNDDLEDLILITRLWVRPPDPIAITGLNLAFATGAVFPHLKGTCRSFRRRLQIDRGHFNPRDLSIRGTFNHYYVWDDPYRRFTPTSVPHTTASLKSTTSTCMPILIFVPYRARHVVQIQQTGADRFPFASRCRCRSCAG